MSDINIEKDDQATQEMLEMMGELSEEMGSSLQSEDDVQADELLSELDGLPMELEEEETPATLEAIEPEEETPLDVDDIDSLMAEIDESTETSIEIPAPSSTVAAETIENTASKDADEHMKASEIDIDPVLSEEVAETSIPEEINNLDDTENLTEAGDPSEIEEILNESEQDTEVDSITEEDNLAPSSEGIADMDVATLVTDDELTAPKEQIAPPEQVEQLISQTQQAVDTMEEAIQIDQEIQEIASNVHNSAQEAIQIAISTSEQAQQSAEQIQQAIEATFTASEKAFKAAKNAGYHIDFEDIHTEKTTPEIIDQLQEIEAKNKKLKEINQNLKQRISELKKS